MGNYNTADRRRMAANHQAMPDGSFPIANEADLHDAIRLVGHAHNPAAAKAHIKRRARALGLESVLPDTWKSNGPLDIIKSTFFGTMINKGIEVEIEISEEDPMEDMTQPCPNCDAQQPATDAYCKDCGTKMPAMAGMAAD